VNFLNDLAQEEVDNQFLKPKVVGIGGSPRKKGNSDVLLKHILNGVREKCVAGDILSISIFCGMGIRYPSHTRLSSVDRGLAEHVIWLPPRNSARRTMNIKISTAFLNY